MQKLILFCGPSGSGKTSLVHYLLQKYPMFTFSVSATTRPKRKNEIDGKDYYFLTVDEFKAKIEKHEFLEWEEVYTNHFYGTLKTEIERIWSKGHHVIFDVDVHGGLNLKKVFGERALAVFVKAPSIQHLENRLKLRETETPESIARRISKAEQEILLAPQFDKIVLNDKMEHAFEQAEELVNSFLNSI